MGNNQKRSGKFYRRNEAEVMKSLGLAPTKNSGSGWVEKEDGYNEYILSQLKSTDAQSMRIQLDDLHKLEYHAIIEHKIPAFIIQFLDTNEMFIMAKPADLPSVAKYLECGKCDIIKSVEMDDTTKSVPKKVIKSAAKAREKFHKEREEKWQKR
jgi:hypothetical protein